MTGAGIRAQPRRTVYIVISTNRWRFNEKASTKRKSKELYMRSRLVSGFVLCCLWLITAVPNARRADTAHFQAMTARTDSPWQRVDATNAEQVAAGQMIYAQHCASCHGAHLEGQPNWKQPLPTGGLPAPPHDKTGHTWHHADQLLFKITKLGGPGGRWIGFSKQHAGVSRCSQ